MGRPKKSAQTTQPSFVYKTIQLLIKDFYATKADAINNYVDEMLTDMYKDLPDDVLYNKITPLSDNYFNLYHETHFTELTFRQDYIIQSLSYRMSAHSSNDPNNIPFLLERAIHYFLKQQSATGHIKKAVIESVIRGLTAAVTK